MQAEVLFHAAGAVWQRAVMLSRFKTKDKKESLKRRRRKIGILVP